MSAKTILLVDDSRTALMMSQMVLRSQRGFRFITASNGEEAVAKAAAERPDLILMDIMMPVMNGLEATRRIREIEALRDVPIIMLTTRSEMEYVEEGFQSGCNDYCHKPLDARELLSKIDSLLA